MFITIRLLYSLSYLFNKAHLEDLGLKLINHLVKDDSFFNVDEIYDFQEKKLVKRLLLLLPGKGCEWHKKTGGCTMCGFTEKVRKIGQKISGKDLILLYKIADLITNRKKPYQISIFNAGSFLNENEIDAQAQTAIIQLIRQHRTIQKILIEARAEYITNDRIREILDNLGDKKLTVAIGLEAADNQIRNEFIRKGLNKATYEKAIQTLKANGVRALTYVFIKPIRVSEQRAIQEAIDTTHYALSKGSDEVALESAFVQPCTLMAELFKKKEFKPPFLWSIIEVVKKTFPFGPIHLGGFNDTPPPIAIPANCPKCSPRIYRALESYRKNYDIDILNNLDTDCECRKRWLEEIT